MNSRYARTFSLILVIALLLAACSSASQPQATNQKPLLVGWSLYPGWYPLVIAEQQGLFEKYNVPVNLVLYDSYGDAAPQVASGLVDAAALVLGDILLEDVGNYASVVLVTDNSNGADQLIASPEVMETRDLQGKHIGFSNGTFGELLVREMLKDFNVSLEDVILVEVPPEQIADAIPATIDIGHTFEPFASAARAKGNGVLFTSADAPGVIVDTIAFRNDVLRDRPQDVRNFINAWFDAVAYWQANPEAGNQIIADATGQNVRDVSFEGIKFFNREANLATFQPGKDMTSTVFTAQTELQFLIEAGAVTKPIQVGDVLNPAYLK